MRPATYRPHAWPPADCAAAAAIWQREIVDRFGDEPGDVPRGATERVLTAIAAALGRRIETVRARFHWAGPSFRPPQNINKNGWRLPAQVDAERFARAQALAARDLTATVFGDPAPGYSALDRRGR